ncbi:Toluene efflux pump outer membrane protein TtgF [Burkholderia cepacia]|nr:Toluene efflux pump outer membrane protein TtgF [Burkholderia cepacia]
MIAMRIRRRPAAVSATAVALVAALAGCTVGPDYQRPDVATPAAWRLDPADGYWHPAAPARAPLDPAWWTAFGDPQLDALEAEALRNNQNLKAVAARYDQAKATLASVASAQYPAVGLNASGQRFKISADRPQTNYATQSMSTVQNDVQVGASVSYELDLVGRVRRSVESAQATTEQARDDFANARLVLTADLASSYFALREFDTEIDVVKRSIDLQQKALDYVSARHDLGAVSGLDLLQQRAQLDATRTQAQLLLQQRVQVETAIATLVGTPAPTFSIAPRVVPINAPALRPACRATCCSGAPTSRRPSARWPPRTRRSASRAPRISRASCCRPTSAGTRRALPACSPCRRCCGRSAGRSASRCSKAAS